MFGKAGINAKVGGTTVLALPPSRAMPVALVVNLDDVDTFLTPCTLSVGTNAPTYTNIAVATAISGLDSLAKGFVLTHTSPVVAAVLPTDDLRCNITIAATGTIVNIGVWVVGILR